ncbi:hypothetical protein TrVGV298_006465 [Trichoderma virens]|nr:hypothetical protein TrVGV298_006465 [Trichoderma virens]
MSSISKVALVTLATLQGANAWGVLGHATVAYVAQHYLNSATASWAQGVLNDTSSSYLASIASWADTYRTTTAGKFSAPFHFIDAEDNPPNLMQPNYTQRVGDGRLSKANTAEALKFLVHFLGDITQPLHDEAYEVGGNDISVTFQGYSDNLHADWDTYIPEALIGGDSLADAQSWANSLISEITSGTYKSQAASWIKGDTVSDVITTATRWASDANAFVCTVVMPNGAAALQKGDLYPTYYNSVIDTVELQIAKGGYRLANWLNMVYTSNIAKREEGSVEARDTSPLPDLMGRDLLPEARAPTRAQLARAAMDGSCCGTGHAHKH